ncbi:hypothetical protein FALBO_6633 [Fusarium albosuccineum]|uniref:Uncharacterized protein n=1 Tax=Fusarium albosuccineum TaxID=1237068 RepID=A0A8H4PEG5_9HYPO|nr:hypothetical protein FALBO_6633 [Fusarium albosuccineum]
MAQHEEHYARGFRSGLREVVDDVHPVIVSDDDTEEEDMMGALLGRVYLGIPFSGLGSSYVFITTTLTLLLARMANGIADIDDWDGMPDPGGVRFRSRRHNLNGLPLRYYSPYEALDTYWENEPCYCYLDDDGPPRGERYRLDGCSCAIGNQVNVFCGDNHQSCQGCRVDRERRCDCAYAPPNHADTRRTGAKDRGRSQRRGNPPMEDVIYYLTKRQRHHNDEQKRIRDWLRVMGDLQGDDQVQDRRYRVPHGRDYIDERPERRAEKGRARPHGDETRRYECQRREPRRYEMSGGRSLGDEGEHHGRGRKVRFNH